MKEILHNIAMLDALNYCKENNIDCSGTKLIKFPRSYTFMLIREKDNNTLLSTTFYKNRTPFRVIHKKNITRNDDIINIDDIPF